MSDCVSLHATEIAELQSLLKLYAISPDATFHAPKYAEAMEKAADAIEALLAENAKLNTELELLRKHEIGCGNCAHVKVSVQEYPCCDCSDYTHDKWEWGGAK